MRRQFTVAGLTTEASASAISQTAARSVSGADSAGTCFDFLRDIVVEFGAVVQHGAKRLFHALPRLLTVLVEYGNDAVVLEEAARGKRPAAEAAAMLDRLHRARKERHDSVRRPPFDNRTLAVTRCGALF